MYIRAVFGVSWFNVDVMTDRSNMLGNSEIMFKVTTVVPCHLYWYTLAGLPRYVSVHFGHYRSGYGAESDLPQDDTTAETLR